ncbi:MAG TPA: ATP-binding protein [Burkholderiales bacterium]
MNNQNPELDRMWRLSMDLMLALAPDGTILAANPAWTRVLGWDDTELRGLSFFAQLHPDDQRKARDEAARWSTGIPTAALDLRHRHKDGSHRWISWSAVPDGGQVYAAGRERVQGTAPENFRPASIEPADRPQRMAALGHFSGVISHDFNNVLQGVAGSLELVRRLITLGRAEETERFLDAAVASTRRGASLTERLQLFSNRVGSRPQALDANAMIAACQVQFDQLVTPAIRFALDLQPDLRTIHGDSEQLAQAMLCLISNAVEALPGNGTITITTRNASLEGAHTSHGEAIAPGEYACIAVTDSGTGMSGEAVRQAFEPLFTTKPKDPGKGLGLSIVYNIVHQSGGYVDIESAPDAGTTVTLYLPATCLEIPTPA